MNKLPSAYFYADLQLISQFPIVELPAVDHFETAGTDLSCGLGAAPPPDPTRHEWIHLGWNGTAHPTLSLARVRRGFLLRFFDLGDFAISEDGSQIDAWPALEADAETLRHLLLDQVLPRLLTHRGRLVLHAGAVRVDDSVIAFLGETGSGKSTLTASFHTAGYQLLSDDALVLTQSEGCPMALPTYPSLRLWPAAVAGLFADAPRLSSMAHYSSKRRVALDDAAETTGQPMPLAAIFILSPGAETCAKTVSLTRLHPRDACMAIIRNCFQLDITDTRRAAALLAQAAAIGRHVPTFRLECPRDFSRLPAVRATVLGQLEHGASSAVDTAGAT